MLDVSVNASRDRTVTEPLRRVSASVLTDGRALWGRKAAPPVIGSECLRRKDQRIEKVKQKERQAGSDFPRDDTIVTVETPTFACAELEPSRVVIPESLPLSSPPMLIRRPVELYTWTWRLAALARAVHRDYHRCCPHHTLLLLPWHDVASLRYLGQIQWISISHWR